MAGWVFKSIVGLAETDFKAASVVANTINFDKESVIYNSINDMVFANYTKYFAAQLISSLDKLQMFFNIIYSFVRLTI